MPLSKDIAPHLPYLRRFARALTGSQASGDAYAVATLEAIVGDNAVFDTSLSPRVALYRVFLRVWASVPINAGVDKGALNAPDQHTLDVVTPRPRVAFVLSAVEDFSTDQIAQALQCPPSEATALVRQAAVEIADQIATDVLIIEDEPLIAVDLEELVQSLGHRVQQIARTHTEAVAAVHAHRPGLILADIQLADGSSGLSAVNEILASFEVPVIFITAFPERLLTGERPEPTFLIAKPYNTDTVKALISQALFFDRKSHRRERS